VGANPQARCSWVPGIALRAPVLAALFLIVTLATLAMPGSPNFVGEILILFGALEDKLIFGLVASLGVALAAVYAIRLFQKSMHNRVGPGVGGGDLCVLDLGAIAPLAAVIVALGIYPQLVLERTEDATTAQITAAAKLTDDGSAKRAERFRVPLGNGYGDLEGEVVKAHD